MLKTPELNLEMLNSIMRKTTEGEDEYAYEDPQSVGDAMMMKMKQKAMYNDGYHADSSDSESDSAASPQRKNTLDTIKGYPSPKKSSGIEN